MMRRILTVVLLVVVAVGFPQTVQASGTLQWSGGISITERTDQSGIFSRLEASRGGELLGCWFSTSGVLPQVFSGLEVDAFGDFPGIRKVQKVELSPDHGMTRWPAEQVEGKGYGVSLPYLPAGSYGLEWGVWSRDKHNRLLLVIIPINWSSTRKSAAANHLMVQSPPPGWAEMTSTMLFAHLRGFVSAWATPDMAVLAQEQALQSMQAPASAGPEYFGMGITSTGVQVGEGQLLEEPAMVPPPAMMPVFDMPYLAPAPAVAPPLCLSEVVLILVAGERRIEVLVRLDLREVREGTGLKFWRDGVVVLIAKVVRVIENRVIEATIPDAMQLCRGDKITIGGAR